MARLTRGGNRTGFQILWHITSLAALGLFIPEIRFHVPAWNLMDAQKHSVELLLAGYAVAAIISLLLGSSGRCRPISAIVISTLAVFGLVFLYCLVSRVEMPRAITLQILTLSCVLIPMASSLVSLRWIGLSLVAITAIAGAFMGLHKARVVEQILHPRRDTSVVRTSFYNLKVDAYTDYFSTPAVRGGGITRFGSDYLLATGDGYLYMLGWPGGGNDISVHRLPFRIPVNGDEFARDTTGGLWQKKSDNDAVGNNGEDANDTVIVWWFRTAGILVQEQGSQVRIFAAHYWWKHDTSCWVERVSLLEGDRSRVIAGSKDLTWRTIFETTPCLPVKGEGRRRGTPFAGHFGGGRMVLLDADTLLLSVGDFGFNGVASKQMLSQDMGSTYGKTVRINIKSGKSEIFTLGHRNPQGLYAGSDGKIWETEQGPQGGDELNLLREGLNYGWPIVTYGVDYGSFGWPLNPKQGEHEGFEGPYFTWLPDIGVSDLVRVEADAFPVWKGDLLVASMAAKTLFRTRIRNDRVVYAEAIGLDKRIRDITEGSDGRLVLWADDDNTIISLRPATVGGGEASFATFCSGCHKVENGLSHRLGPDLWGVIGRKVASADGYVDYSSALHRFGGEWTTERINNFISNPQQVVPGTAMEFGGVSDPKVRASIIEYLRGAKKMGQ